MARFKEWLITEDADSGSDWFYGNSVYPSDAFDWNDSYGYPSDFSLLQSRWKKERDQWGRKFHGFDPQSTINQKFTSIYSNTMPDTGEGGWKHSSKERSDLKIDKDAELLVTGVGKSAKIPNVLSKSNDLLDKTEELNRVFGDFKPSMWQLPTNFDEPWSPYTGSTKMKYAKKKSYGKDVNNFG